MKFPNLSDEKHVPKMDEKPTTSNRSTVSKAVTAHHPGDAYNKLASLFRGRFGTHRAETKQSQTEDIPARPAPSSFEEVPRQGDPSGKNINPDLRLRTFVTGIKNTSPDKVLEKVTDKNLDKAPGKVPDKGLEKVTDKNLEKTPGKVPGKAPEKILEKAPDRVPIKTPEKVSGKPLKEASAKLRLRPNREATRRAYWDVAAAFSLIVNAILVGVLLVMVGQIRNLKTTMNDLLGGLYNNFVEMDKSGISTTIPVQAQIPVVFSLPIQQDTNVTLTAAVPISGAQVVINSGGLSINAPANVTLPAGTNLPIALNMTVPVQLTVPISLQIPVNIPLNQTDLHTPFTGLEQTIRPLYCTLDKNAQNPQGVYICAEHDIATPTAP